MSAAEHLPAAAIAPWISSFEIEISNPVILTSSILIGRATKADSPRTDLNLVANAFALEPPSLSWISINMPPLAASRILEDSIPSSLNEKLALALFSMSAYERLPFADLIETAAILGTRPPARLPSSPTDALHVIQE